jgi:hypothetical protein
MIFSQINQTEDNDLITNSVTFTPRDIIQNNTIISFKKQEPIAVNQSKYVLDSKQKKAHGLWKCNIYIK